MSIEVSELSKNYAQQAALQEVSFKVAKGEVVGFLGPNGAGKSTLMKLLTGYLAPTSGLALVNDINVMENPIAAQKHIGYLPEHNPLYDEMYVVEYLQFRASLYKINPSVINDLIATVGLTPEAHKKIKALSKGYRQRVGIAAALLHDPQVLILDEPTTGLDPNQLVGIRSLIKTLGATKTILFSTHILQEVAAVCDRVIIIHKGVLQIDSPLSELTESLEVVFQKVTSS